MIVITENDVVLNIQKLIMLKGSIMLVIKQNFKSWCLKNIFFCIKTIFFIEFFKVKVLIDIFSFLFFLQMSLVSSNLEVPVFYPSYDEFKDFSAFISSIEARGAHRIGLAKIVPPKEWKACQMGYKQKQIDEKMVENPIKQEVHGKDGVYSVFNIQQRSIKLNSFKKLASSNRYAPPHSISNDLEKLEKKYWQSLTSNAPIYGAGTFF
jgi:hypothetical protein